jgi:hypothetical protein
MKKKNQTTKSLTETKPIKNSVFRPPLPNDLDKIFTAIDKEMYSKIEINL